MEQSRLILHASTGKDGSRLYHIELETPDAGLVKLFDAVTYADALAIVAELTHASNLEFVDLFALGRLH